MTRLRHSTWTLLSALALATAVAEDWPEFRGPTGQGHSETKNLPITWSETSNVAWKVAIPGNGWSSPVVSAGQLFLTTAVPMSGGFSLRTLRLNPTNGTVSWNVEVFRESANSSGIHDKNSHASPTPIISGDRIYVHFGHEGTAALDRSGNLVWRNTTLRYQPVHGNGGSPVLTDDKLIFSCDGAANPFVAALNIRDGFVAWRVPRNTTGRDLYSFSTPLVIQVNGQSQVLSPASNMIGAYDPKDGRELWRVRYDGYSVVPRPVFSNDLIYLGTGYDNPVVLAIRPGGRGDVTGSSVAWTMRRSAPNTPSLLCVTNELYMVSDGGIASCVDAKTGVVIWQGRLSGNYSASPVFADGRIYFQSEEGVGTVLRPGRRLEILSRNQLNERTLASYAIADQAIFIRGDSHLYRIQSLPSRPAR